MIKSKIDMTGWVMKDHGFPESRLTVIKQVASRTKIFWNRICSAKRFVQKV